MMNFFFRLIKKAFLQIIETIAKINTFIILTVFYFSVVAILSFYYMLQRLIKNLHSKNGESYFIKVEE